MQIFSRTSKGILFTIFILCVNLQLNFVYAQSSEFKFKHYTVEDGLSQNTIYSIVQDHLGFMWFGTRTGGLSKFDGYSFVNYKHNKLDPFGISGNEIIALYEDSKGTLWAGTRNDGLNRFDQETERFYTYLSNINDTNSLLHNTINTMFEDANGTLWIGTNNGLCTYNRINDNFIRYSVSNEIGGVNIKAITSAGKDLLWLGSRTGLFLFHKGEKRVLSIFNHDKSNLQSLSDSFITSLATDGKGRLWIGTNNGGLSRLDDIKTKAFKRYQNNAKDRTSLASNLVRTLHVDKQGVIWIGTRNGLDLLYPDQQDCSKPEFRHYYSSEWNRYGLNQNSIFSFYESQFNDIWIGTYSGGINYLYNGDQKFKHFKHSLYDPLSLSYNMVSSFAENEDGIWVGTEGGGLNLLDKKTNSFKVFSKDASNRNGLISDRVKSLFIDSDNDLWVGTFEGLQLYNKEGNRFRLVIDEAYVYTIEEGLKGELWIGTINGLYKLQKSDFTIVKYMPDISDPNSISYHTINKIFKDSQGRIWIGTKSGLNLYNRAKNNFISFQRISNDDHSLSHSHVTSIEEDVKGNLWIGTIEGLNWYDFERNRFYHFDINVGFPDNVISNILADKHGNLWITSNSGLCKFNPNNFLNSYDHPDLLKTIIYRSYDLDDGLQNIEFKENASYRNKNGAFFLGGNNGFNFFYPDSVKDNNQIPHVAITEFKLFNKPVAIATPNSPLSKHITYTESISLNYKQSVLSFGFVALNYISPEKNQFAYMMEGYDKEWNYIGRKREATYTSLPAGDYVFRVKASNNDGVWNEEGTSINIKILPPWWNSKWFRFSSLLLGISFLIAFYYIRITLTKRQNIYLEKKVKERTKELDEKNKELFTKSMQLNETNAILEERQQHIEEQSDELTAQRDELVDVNAVKDKLFSVVAHDLKNPFGIILGFSELLVRKYDQYNDEKRKSSINNIFESSKVIYELLTSLLNWSQAQMGQIKPKFERCNIIEIIESNIKLAAVQAQDKEIEIISNTDSTVIQITIDANLISTVVRNLISNALKFTPKGGNVIVSCIKEPERVVISIKDTGVGINEKELSALFKKKYHHTSFGTNKEKGTGLGLIICLDFVLMHSGEIWVTSEERKGSEFSFSLPL